jgi:tetratricopeptide (TPR) repeat protein
VETVTPPRLWTSWKPPGWTTSQAAQHFRSAASLVGGEDLNLKLGYLIRSADALRLHGNEKGDNAILVQAIGIYREILRERSRETEPMQWALVQNKLGIALGTLGARESGIARLEEAMIAFREALKERTRERVPLDWAGTKNDLGIALRSLGGRESGTARLKEAAEVFREALKKYTRERVPLYWAKTQNNLGNALRELGERESGTARLEEAREAIGLAWGIFRKAGMVQHDATFKTRLNAVDDLITSRNAEHNPRTYIT